VVRTTLADLAAGAADAPLLDDDGAPVDPVVLVDLTGRSSAPEAAAAAEAAARTPRIVVGVATGEPPAVFAAAADVTFVATVPPGQECVRAADVEEAACRFAAAASGSPRAALVLARLLRWSSQIAVPDALDAESLAYSTLLGGPEFRRWLDGRGPRPSPPDVTDSVLVDRAGDVLHVTLNRPERRNAYGRQIRDGLTAALDVAAADPTVGRVVLDGAGPCFCSGGDLDEFGVAPDPVTAHLVRGHGGAALPLHRVAGRTEVRVHGTCVGSGVELAALAGRVVADPGTTFRLPEVGMGLIPGAGGTVGITRRIGRWRCLELAVTGRTMTATEALSSGLVDALV
jgi:enoyl-CoA hydratase/carnithine racemase